VISYDEKENVIKLTPFRRKRLTIKLGRKITLEEMEKSVEDFINETS